MFSCPIQPVGKMPTHLLAVKEDIDGHIFLFSFLVGLRRWMKALVEASASVLLGYLQSHEYNRGLQSCKGF